MVMASEAPADERAGKQIGLHLNHRATSRLYSTRDTRQQSTVVTHDYEAVLISSCILIVR